MNLTEIAYYMKMSDNKTALFFHRRKQNENHHTEIVEDLC